MTPRLPFAAALPRVHGGIPAWGILSGACWARRDTRETSANSDSRNVDNAVSRSAIARGAAGSCS